MIEKFLTSRFSGYLSVLAVIVVLGMVFYIYHEGKKACVGAVAVEQVKVEQKSKKGADNVRKDEQSLRSDELNLGLCQLGIVRENSGCK